MNDQASLPAILGGKPVRPQGPPGWPVPDERVLAVLKSACEDGSWGRYEGVHGERLRQSLREYLRVEHVLACGSGTFAIELALRALRIGPGDEVILSAYDYPGNFLSVHAMGASPVLIDCDPNNWNMAAEVLPAAVSERTGALIVSHLHGGMAPMTEITHLARKHGIAVVEDAAQAPGAIVEGRIAGTWGDLGVWSFGGSKLLSAGRGGAVFTQSAELYQRARVALYRGNVLCPLSELQAAVLLPQLERLDERNARRAEGVRVLSEAINNTPGLQLLRNRTADTRPGYYKLGFQYDAAGFGLSRKLLVRAMQAEGIAIDEGFSAAHVGRSPRRFRQAADLTQAQRAHEGMLILHHPILLGTRGEVQQVADAFHKIHENREAIRSAPGVS